MAAVSNTRVTGPENCALSNMSSRSSEVHIHPFPAFRKLSSYDLSFRANFPGILVFPYHRSTQSHLTAARESVDYANTSIFHSHQQTTANFTQRKALVSDETECRIPSLPILQSLPTPSYRILKLPKERNYKNKR